MKPTLFPSTPARRRRIETRAARAFTLIEVIVVVLIIGILAAVIAPRLFSRVGQAKHSAASSNAATLASAMRTFIIDCGMPPPGSTLDILWECPSGVDKDAWSRGGPYIDNKDALLDPWGKPYILLIPGKKNVDFDILSYGADGQPGGAGENADITKP